MPASLQFHANATSFSATNAVALACAAELVYCEPAEVQQAVIEQWGFKRFAFVDDRDTQAFVASSREATIVCFRGTEPNSFTDWFTDLHTELIPGPLGGKVHAGFYNALSDVWQLLIRQIARFDEGRNKPLWVTGHSLGAALATLAVARWIEQRHPVQGLYTFGQPRSGDATFARNFNFEFKPFTHRFVNNNDLVTRIPPRSIGYSHLGTFRYFSENGEYLEHISWWQMFLDRWRGQLEHVLELGLDGIHDHKMTAYRECVQRLPRKPHPSVAEDRRPPATAHRHTASNDVLIRPRRRAA